jgi:RNA-directed DNA polymerase
MHGPGKSDSSVVPGKFPNNAGPPAEGTEGSELAKGNLPQQNASRTPSRSNAPPYHPETLRMVSFSLKKEASPGVGGETWQHYGEGPEENLEDLSSRLQRGAYRAKPVRRIYIPKADWPERPLGVTALEGKIVQRAAVEVLNALYETVHLSPKVKLPCSSQNER